MITSGLDPAGPLFTKLNSLSKKDGDFVQIIHTNPCTTCLSPAGPYGENFSAGTIDFWPNYQTKPHQTVCVNNSTISKYIF